MAEDALAQYADQLIYLCSAQASSQLIIVAQRKVETQIDALKLEHVKIDGMVEENKPARAAIWKKVDAKPGTYPIVINMKTGDFWHGDELQAPQRHARALPCSPLPSHPSPPLPVCRTRSMPTSSRRSFPPSSSERPEAEAHARGFGERGRASAHAGQTCSHVPNGFLCTVDFPCLCLAAYRVLLYFNTTHLFGFAARPPPPSAPARRARLERLASRVKRTQKETTGVVARSYL